MADINKLIEQFAAGVKSSVREDVTTGDLEGFEDFSLSTKPALKTKTKTKATPAAKDTLAKVTALEAARAVRDAVAAKGGRRPKVDYWKPVAAKTLGISKLFAKRWQGVIDAGTGAGLFRIDTEALAHPILVALDPEPEAAPVEDEVVYSTKSRTPVDKDDFDYNAPWPPPGYVAPVTFRCGHTNHNGFGTTEDDPKQVEAREAGHCCGAMRRAAEATAKHKWNRAPTIHVDWRVRGLWDPLPKALRRTPERDDGPGFPGLCCDPKTGLYIGGLANDCRHYNKGKERCVAHAPKKRGDK
jgi:hypothetical protein